MNVPVLEQYTEANFFWQEKVKERPGRGAKEETFGRFTTIFSIPPNMYLSPLGNFDEFVDAQGRPGHNLCTTAGNVIRQILKTAL